MCFELDYFTLNFIGKSTAVQCALSICGQHKVSHLMKTKGTSDSLCMERIKKSTLPFSLDDPKSIEDIGELLIQLCNGQLSGNLRVGLHRPRSIPLLCCNFTVSKVQRSVNSIIPVAVCISIITDLIYWLLFVCLLIHPSVHPSLS